MGVELELGVLHDLEALGISLHQAVLDPVVHHLDEVSGTGAAYVRVTLLRSERREDGLEPFHGLVIAADHQAEPDLEAPDSARDARVDEVHAALLRLAVAPLRVTEVRVAPVDDRVAFVDEPDQLLEDVFRDLASGDHHPERAGCIELFLQLGERPGGTRLNSRIVGLYVMPALAESLRHAGAHPAEPDHSELGRHAGVSSPRFALIPSSSCSKESANFSTPSRSSVSTTSS